MKRAWLVSPRCWPTSIEARIWPAALRMLLPGKELLKCHPATPENRRVQPLANPPGRGPALRLYRCGPRGKRTEAGESYAER